MSVQIFFANITYLRRSKNITQQKFSDKIEVPRQRYASWEERRAEPCIDALILIANAHDFSLDELLTKDLAKA